MSISGPFQIRYSARDQARHEEGITSMDRKTFLTLGILASIAVADTPDHLQLADAAVTENLKTEAGRKYADTASSVAAKPLAAAMMACKDSLAGESGKLSGAPDTGAIEIYLMLNRRGRLKDLVASPQSNVGDCLARKARGNLALPFPPGANYWIRVRVPVSPSKD